MHVKKVAVNLYLALCHGHFPVNIGEGMVESVREKRLYNVCAKDYTRIGQ